MELKKYLRILKNYFGFILIFTVITALAAYLGSVYKPAVYEGGLTFSISPVSQNTEENPPYYEYDGFYAIQASQLFANTVSAWLSSPDIVQAIYKEADINLNVSNVKELSEKIKTSVRTAQSTNNITDVVFQASNKTQIKKLAEATYTILNRKVQQFNQSTGNKINYKINQSGEPVIVKVTTNIWLNTILGLIAGLILSIILSFLFYYFKHTKI